MPVRLKDIAAALGVSSITVSKVLRNKPDVGDETRKRVLAMVQEMNYRPNLLARGLASGKSATVGLIVPDLVHTFFAEFAKGLKAGLRRRGYQLVLASAEEDPEVEVEEMHTLVARGVDAILIASCREKLGALRSIQSAGVPYVLVDRLLPKLAAPFVGTDDIAAGTLATEHLLSLGRRRIAHVGAEKISTGVDRWRGYRDTLLRHGLSYVPELVVSRSRMEESGDEAGRTAMQQFLAMEPCPDAVFCYNDLAAVGVIDAVLAAGLRVPEDVAVIGCGNLRLASYLQVPLSSIDQRTDELGEKAAQLVVSLLEGEARESRHEVRVSPAVVARASTLGSGNGSAPTPAGKS